MMRRLLMVMAAAGASASADVPKMGGEMNHILVSVFQKTVYVGIERPEELPLDLYNYREHYDGAASVLDRSGYNSQLGWLANGFISLPPDAEMWVEAIHRDAGLRAYGELGFEPILGTPGSSTRWVWNGTMTHNWYAASALGTYNASYRVYVGTWAGDLYPGYTPGFIALSWEYLRGGLGGVFGSGVIGAEDVSRVPSPDGLALVGGSLGGLLVRRRRA